jgi:hypothetical protein
VAAAATVVAVVVALAITVSRNLLFQKVVAGRDGRE